MKREQIPLNDCKIIPMNFEYKRRYLPRFWNKFHQVPALKVKD